MNKSKETFCPKIPLDLEEDWFIGSTKLKVFNSVLFILNGHNKFNFHHTKVKVSIPNVYILLNENGKYFLMK